MVLSRYTDQLKEVDKILYKSVQRAQERLYAMDVMFKIRDSSLKVRSEISISDMKIQRGTKMLRCPYSTQLVM